MVGVLTERQKEEHSDVNVFVVFAVYGYDFSAVVVRTDDIKRSVFLICNVAGVYYALGFVVSWDTRIARILSAARGGGKNERAGE